MANAPTEQLTYVDPALQQEIEQIVHSEVPLTMAVPEMATDAVTRQKAARFIGACVVDGQAEIAFLPETVSPIESLFDAIQQAAQGSNEAKNMIQTNVATDVIERTIKKGHVIKIDLHVDQAGTIQQFGQSMESVQANSLKLAANSWQMRERTEAEATNTFRINDHYRRGTLKDYNFVVFSRAADNMSRTEMDAAGFFTETMSVAVQVTTQEGDKLTTESAFVAGVRAPDEARHDAETITKLGNSLGVELETKSAAELINTPLLIHKSLMPNGAIDLVQLYDEAAGGTFFGEQVERQDYLQYRTQCGVREQQLQPKIMQITNQLIQEVATITDRLQAKERLGKLSGETMAELATTDYSIDPRVFGAEAAALIVDSRLAYEWGNTERAQELSKAAQRVEKSSSCPDGTTGLSKEAAKSDAKIEELKDCDFVSKECPKCHKKNVKTTVRKGRYYGACGCKS